MRFCLSSRAEFNNSSASRTFQLSHTENPEISTETQGQARRNRHAKAEVQTQKHRQIQQGGEGSLPRLLAARGSTASYTLGLVSNLNHDRRVVACAFTGAFHLIDPGTFHACGGVGCNRKHDRLDDVDRCFVGGAYRADFGPS